MKFNVLNTLTAIPSDGINKEPASVLIDKLMLQIEVLNELLQKDDEMILRQDSWKSAISSIKYKKLNTM